MGYVETARKEKCAGTLLVEIANKNARLQSNKRAFERQSVAGNINLALDIFTLGIQEYFVADAKGGNSNKMFTM